MSQPVESHEEGWTWEQLNWALSEPPGDYDCSGGDCDCCKRLETWRRMRRTLGIWTDRMGNA